MHTCVRKKGKELLADGLAEVTQNCGARGKHFQPEAAKRKVEVVPKLPWCLRGTLEAQTIFNIRPKQRLPEIHINLNELRPNHIANTALILSRKLSRPLVCAQLPSTSLLKLQGRVYNLWDSAGFVGYLHLLPQPCPPMKGISCTWPTWGIPFDLWRSIKNGPGE